MSKYYIARDENNTICIYDKLPFKKGTSWHLTNDTNVCVLSDDIFPEVKWEDKEPKILTIEESTWIKVEDRLPKDNETTVVLYKNIVTNDYVYMINIWYNGKLTTTHTNILVAIAWMPIPEFKE